MKKNLIKMAMLLLPTFTMMSGELNITPDEVSNLTLGETFIIEDLKPGDDFSNTGFTQVGVPFLCVDANPLNWTHGSYVLKQNLSLIQSFNNIDPNASIVKVSQNIFEIKVTNSAFTLNKTIPMITGSSFVKVIDANTIRFNNQNGASYYKIEVIQ